jgi:hypothetical protein
MFFEILARNQKPKKRVMKKQFTKTKKSDKFDDVIIKSKPKINRFNDDEWKDELEEVLTQIPHNNFKIK